MIENYLEEAIRSDGLEEICTSSHFEVKRRRKCFRKRRDKDQFLLIYGGEKLPLISILLEVPCHSWLTGDEHTSSCDVESVSSINLCQKASYKLGVLDCFLSFAKGLPYYKTKKLNKMP